MSRKPALSDNRSIAIFGANGGCGIAIATRLAHEAAITLGYFRNKDAVDALAEQITLAGGKPLVHQVDIRDGDSVQKFLEAAVSHWGRLDSIVVAAGATIPLMHVVDFSDSLFRNAVDTELIGPFNVIKRGIPILRSQTGSNRSILFLLTMAMMRTLEFDGLSYVPKMGTYALMRQTAREVGREGIRLNAIGVGAIRAGLGSESATKEQPAAEFKSIIDSALEVSGCWGRPEEVADVAAFFLSDSALYVNGQCLCVDGGYSA